MRIDIISPILPPTLDGIGDHTSHLAKALAAEGCDIRIVTAQKDWRSLAGVRVEQGFDLDRRSGILDVVDPICEDPPDCVLLQFEQFSYGRWGLNPYLPLALWRLRKACRGMQIAVMFHEDFTRLSSIRFAIMSAWQRPQFWTIGQLADTALFSTEPWAEEYRHWFPNTDVCHLPVGSNIPDRGATRVRERRRHDISEDVLVLGLFGSAHPSRLLSHVNASVAACRTTGTSCQLLYVGPDGDRVRKLLEDDLPLIDAGPLSAADVSKCLSTVDVYLAPFEYGVSTRRGSFLAGLQHGLPTVSTVGPETGQVLRKHDGAAFELSPWSNREAFVSAVLDLANRPDIQENMGKKARSLYQSTFDWPQIAKSLRSNLNQTADAQPVSVC